MRSMYSGITRGLFSVVALEPRDGVTRFSVELSPELAHDAQIGASVAVDGVCLTLVERTGTRLSFEVTQRPSPSPRWERCTSDER